MGLANMPRTVEATEFANLVTDLQAILTRVNQLSVAVGELKTDMSQHVHGGVTAGSANTSAGPTIAAAVTETPIVLLTT